MGVLMMSDKERWFCRKYKRSVKLLVYIFDRTAAGTVLVNGIIEKQKRKKMVAGDTIELDGGPVEEPPVNPFVIIPNFIFLLRR